MLLGLRRIETNERKRRSQNSNIIGVPGGPGGRENNTETIKEADVPRRLQAAGPVFHQTVDEEIPAEKESTTPG